ncbi:hypothetical protein BGW38_009063 [Lunasporangiospora selenospora]|uniref:Calcineurin-like phosphoesterase domain-containing protein n=1 Tax=Lunasporangiospora selenospora TaxID=979761 RepID=A0A9P6KIE8_9FUNG|nr:hypothetical protein BGW38_009063 [Lunasporangiospora selenospora]
MPAPRRGMFASLILALAIIGLSSCSTSTHAFPLSAEGAHHPLVGRSPIRRQDGTPEIRKAHLYLADQAMLELEDILDSPDLDSCQMCQQGLKLAKNLAQKAPEFFPGVLRTLCAQYKFWRLDSCAVPLHQPKPIAFPKPKPANARQPAPSGEKIQVLHFSDWHVDPHYKPGTEAKCSHNICCRDYGRWNDPGPIQKPASKWGEGKCDTPIELGVSALEAIPQFVKNASFGLFTGDIVSHDSWMVTEKYIADEESKSYELFKSYLHDLKLYVVLGNHDSYPSDQAPGRHRPNSYIAHKWLYDHVAKIWEKNNWITTLEAEYARSHNAMYMTRPTPGLKLITLNTDLYYVRNYFTLLDSDQDDPSGMFHDLIMELQDSEDRNERVWIMGHMAPIARSLPRSSILFQRIVARYSPHVIAGLFFGHFHQDKFFVFHDPDAADQNADSAINVAYQGPSITPLDRANPAIRWYDVDAKTFSVLDTHTAYTDILGQGSFWEENDMRPEWKLEYSAREAYDNPSAPLAPEEPLSPKFWHSVSERMKTDRPLFEKYLKYESKSSIEAEMCEAGSLCEKEKICQMQASTVIQAEACSQDDTALLNKKNKNKKNKKRLFSTTRAGVEVDDMDYSEERGVVDTSERERADTL